MARTNETDAAPEAASELLAWRFGGAARSIQLLGRGYWAVAYGFELGGRRLVLRLGAHREDFEKDREAAGYSGRHLPVPKVLETGEAAGGAYAISERCDGTFLEHLSPSTTGWLEPLLWQLLDALSDVPVDASRRCVDETDGPFATWRDFLSSPVDRPGRVSGWWPRVASDPELSGLYSATRAAVDDLVERGGAPELRYLLHLDLLNRNVLVDESRRVVTGVFDWGCRIFGDPVYEIATISFFAPWHETIAALHLEERAPPHFALAGRDLHDYGVRLRCGELHVGLNHIAYSAFTGVEEDIAAVAARTADLLSAPLLGGGP